MIKEILRLSILLMLGMMIYDLHEKGVNSEVYCVLEENGVVEYGETFMAELRTFANKAMKFSKDEKPKRRDMDIHTLIDLFCEMMIKIGEKIASLFESSGCPCEDYCENDVDEVPVLTNGALTSTKSMLELLTSQLQDYQFSALNYVRRTIRT